MGGTRGCKIEIWERREVAGLIQEAVDSGSRLSKACETAGISIRTLQRWRSEGVIKGDGRKEAAQLRTPSNKLSEEEFQLVLETVNQEEFASLPPSQIVPALADKGVYIASESTFSRILRESRQNAHRGKSKAPVAKKPEPLVATGPNQVWSWDITYMPTLVKGIFFYLYLILDVYSRKIVGWDVYENESSEHAALVVRKACLKEGIGEGALTLHSDNGSPMKGATMLATLQHLGIVTSFSRPSVSNDNPYSEALFKTLKYHPGYPEKKFDGIENSREWVKGFQHWYNEVHKHSAIKFVSPAQRHEGKDVGILKLRGKVYEDAKVKHPERWSGKTRDWQPIGEVSLNPGKHKKRWLLS